MILVADRTVTSASVAQQSGVDATRGDGGFSLIELRAEPTVLAPARRALAELLRRAGFPNIVEHAYPSGAAGTFDVSATCDRAGTLTVTITDRGVWNSAGPDPASRRGRGLQLVRACADRSEVACGDTGTRVLLQWRGAPSSATPYDEQGG